MKELHELLSDEPFIDYFNRNVEKCTNHMKVLSPKIQRGKVLQKVQVPTKSVLGSLAYFTGGVIIDHGWVRRLGSGCKQLDRNLPDWNTDVSGMYFVGDDAAGGFFALNGGAFPGELSIVHYWSPDSIEWESLDLKYSEFVIWPINADLDNFYGGIRWKNWREDTAHVSHDKCYNFYPPLWSAEGDCESSYRGVVPISEAREFKVDIFSQIGGA